MSGTTNILLAPPGGGAVLPPYSLDGLGANDPPVINAGWVGGGLTFSFNYTVPDDGNQFRWMFIVMVADPPHNRTTSIDYGGQGVSFSTFNQVQDQSPLFSVWYLAIPVDYNGGPINDTFIISRANTGGIPDVDFNIRVYTFGNVSTASTQHIQFPPLDLDVVSSTTFNLDSPAQQRSAIIGIGARTDYTPATGQDTLITDPVGIYTYSPTGDQGVGLLTNASEACVIEMAFDVSPGDVNSTTWDLLNGQTGEGGAAYAVELVGVTV